MTVVHPIARAWISTGGTGARNYDEFADDAEITEIIAANPASALAIEMPHRAPESLGKSFADALPDAVARLPAAKADGSYAAGRRRPRCSTASAAPDGEPAYGLCRMVDTDQISTCGRRAGPGHPQRGRVHREGPRTGRAGRGDRAPALAGTAAADRPRRPSCTPRWRGAAEAAGAPAVTDVDHGRAHPRVWPVPPATARASCWPLAGGGELVVADGNHRSLAAQTGRPAAVPGRGHHAGVGRDPAVQPAGHRLPVRRPSCRPAARAGADGHAGDGPASRPAGHGHPVRGRDGAYAVDAAAPTAARHRGQPGPRAGRAGAAARRARPRPGRQADHLRRRRLPGRTGWPARSTPAGPTWPC